jgi:hypothetical protein
MKSKKIHNKKKLTKKYKIKLEKKIKNLFTKKIKQIYKISNKFNKSKKFKKKYKKYLQLGGDGGITGDTTKFLQYSGTGNVAPGDTKGGQLRAAETIGEAVGMLAVDIPVVATQFVLQESLDPIVPCIGSAPDAKAIAGTMACTLFEGVSANMVANGVAGESTGASPQQTLSQNSHAT